MLKKMMSFLYIIGATYLISLLVLYVFQRRMIYVPDQTAAFNVSEKRTLTYKTVDGLELTSFFSLPKINEKTILVLFHGNAGHAGHRYQKTAGFIQAGYGVVVMGYRGYGGNAGRPSENVFYGDADGLMQTLIEKGHAPENIILYGESLGTGVASYIATKYPVKGMILETPYTSLTNVASEHYPVFPVKILMRDRFDTMSRLSQIKAPILFMHGTDDQVIPMHHSHDLYNACQGIKQIKIFEGGAHNNLFDYGAADVSLNFIQGLNQ